MLKAARKTRGPMGCSPTSRCERLRRPAQSAFLSSYVLCRDLGIWGMCEQGGDKPVSRCRLPPVEWITCCVASESLIRSCGVLCTEHSAVPSNCSASSLRDHGWSPEESKSKSIGLNSGLLPYLREEMHAKRWPGTSPEQTWVQPAAAAHPERHAVCAGLQRSWTAVQGW